MTAIEKEMVNRWRIWQIRQADSVIPDVGERAVRA